MKLRKTVGIISRLRHVCPRSILLTIYHSLFASHINYASQIWGQHSSPNLSRVLKLQKSAIRLITFSGFRQPSKPLFHQLGVMSITDSIIVQNVLLTYKILNNLAPKNICDNFSLEYVDSGYPTRIFSLRLLKRPAIRTTSFGTNSIQYQCILNWNSLQTKFPEIDISSLSFNKLKALAKESILK